MPISPNQGSTGGGTAVTITGTNLANASAVTFGTKPATITANTATSVSVLSPSGNVSWTCASRRRAAPAIRCSSTTCPRRSRPA
ncbi:IPT/TIG domain-containing protein [Streptomyces sp. 6N223]|uniref:IPT/TIG domain-containing protein n=1 Tax=Streptomyces sp. 6N223 TaxID=3457412 RepID=UPI003FD4CC3E